MTAHGWTPAPVAVRGDATGSHWETTRPAPAQAGADSWCTVRVRGPRGGVDVALPASQTVAETVDELAARLLPGAPLGRPGETWYLHRLGRPPFHPSARLVEVDLRDGESLHLSPHPMPRPAQPVDDGLVALAEGAARAPRWSPTAVTVVAAVATVLAATAAAVLALLLPGGAVVDVALALALAGGAPALRARGAEVAALAAVLGALPAFAGGALGAAIGSGATLPAAVAATTGAVALGAALGSVVVPTRPAWWIAVGAPAATAAPVALVVALGLLTVPGAAAVAATLWLVGLVTAPWLTTRARSWVEPDAGDEQALLDRAAAARRAADAVALAGAVVVATAGLVVAAAGTGLALGFVGAVSATIALRARRTVFLVESAAELAAGAVGAAAVVTGLAAGGGTGLRIVLLVAVVGLTGLLVALGLAGRRAVDRAVAVDEAGPDPLGWWSRPRSRRTLSVLEGVAAVAVLPLLLGVLGVYAAAADAGAGL